MSKFNKLVEAGLTAGNTPATPAPKKAAKKVDAKKAAFLAKRAERLGAVKVTDPLKYKCLLSIREAREGGLVAKGAEGWKAFCSMKAAALHEFWLRRANAGGGEKAKLRMIERAKRLAAKLAELNENLGLPAGTDIPAAVAAMAAPAVAPGSAVGDIFEPTGGGPAESIPVPPAAAPAGIEHTAAAAEAAPAVA